MLRDTYASHANKRARNWILLHVNIWLYAGVELSPGCVNVQLRTAKTASHASLPWTGTVKFVPWRTSSRLELRLLCHVHMMNVVNSAAITQCFKKSGRSFFENMSLRNSEQQRFMSATPIPDLREFFYRLVEILRWINNNKKKILLLRHSCEC